MFQVSAVNSIRRYHCYLKQSCDVDVAQLNIEDEQTFSIGMSTKQEAQP